MTTDSSITVEFLDSQLKVTNKHSPLPLAEVMPLPRHGHGLLLMAQPTGPGNLAQFVVLLGVGSAGMAANRQKTKADQCSTSAVKYIAIHSGAERLLSPGL